MKEKLYDVQPAWCRCKLPIISNWNKLITRVFLFDPTTIYDRINEKDMLNPFERRNSVSVKFLFQSKNGLCACGCGQELKGRRRRWASIGCKNFAYIVYSIIAGDASVLRKYRSVYIGGLRCEVCGNSDNVELDHIYPVKFGGGGGWLSNYQFKCKPCHRKKTNQDFGFKLLNKQIRH